MDHSKLEDLEALNAKQIASICFADPVLFCRFFLSDMFSQPVPWVHRGLLAILTRKTEFLTRYGELNKLVKNFVVRDDSGSVTRQVFNLYETPNGPKLQMHLGRFTLVMLPRGFSKTTIAGIAVPLYDTLYQNCQFTCYISEALSHAEMQLESVKRQLATNSRISAVFGNLQPSGKDDVRWRSDFFETTTGIAMAARGRGGQVRGLLHNGRRPSKIIFDDVEDKESVQTEEQRKKARVWAYGDMVPALPELDPSATMIGLGTLLHPESLLMTLSRDPQFTVVRMEVVDSDGDFIWPENMDQVKYEEKKNSFALAGELSTFHMEYHNRWRDVEGQKFRQDFFKYGLPDGYKAEDYRRAMFHDPAISEKLGRDASTVAVVGIGPRGQIVVEETWGKRGASPRECLDMFFSLRKKWNTEQHGVESNAYQKAFVHILREEMFRRHDYFEVLPVTHATSNAFRINGILQPRYASGYVYHRNREPALEAELLDFPSSRAHDDWATAVAGAVALLDPYAAAAASGDDLGKDEYEPLGDVLESFRGAP